MNEPTVIAAVIAALAAVIAAILTGLGQVRIANIQHDLEQTRDRESREVRAQQILSRYRDPLLQAAYDLQSRIFNVLVQNLLFVHYTNGTESEREYVIENTLYCAAQYFAWIEIIRESIQFLDLGTEDLTQAAVSSSDDRFRAFPDRPSRSQFSCLQRRSAGDG